MIELYANNKLKIVLDFGQNSENGPFEGIDSVIKAVQVCLENIDNFLYN